MALGKARFALSDLTKVLELKPDFTAARLQRGSVHMKIGDYQMAEIDLNHVVSKVGSFKRWFGDKHIMSMDQCEKKICRILNKQTDKTSFPHIQDDKTVNLLLFFSYNKTPTTKKSATCTAKFTLPANSLLTSRR